MSFRRSLLIQTLICALATLSAQDPKAKAMATVKEALLKEVNTAPGRCDAKTGEELYVFIYDMSLRLPGRGCSSEHGPAGVTTLRSHGS